jgi:hypothetical protein
VNQAGNGLDDLEGISAAELDWLQGDIAGSASLA